MTRPEQRKKESASQYADRCHRWEAWRRAEPCPDHSYTDDTEVAEYRAWAGTAGLHERRVDELMEIVEGDR